MRLKLSKQRRSNHEAEQTQGRLLDQASQVDYRPGARRVAAVNSPARCKCGKFVRTELCPDCRKAKQAEDKTVRFLIGEVVKVKKPVVVPVDVGMCYSGE